MHRAEQTGAAARRVTWWAVLVTVALASLGPVARLAGSAASFADALTLVLTGAAMVAVLAPVSSDRAAWSMRIVGVLVGAVTGLLAWNGGLAYPWVVVVASAVVAVGAVVRWSLVPSWPQRTGAVAGPAVGLLLLAGWSWYRTGSLVRLGILLLAALVVLECWSRWHALADRVDGAVAAGARLIGDALGAVLAWVVFAVVVMPVHLVSRLVGYSPLSSGRVTPTTAWVAVAGREGGRSGRPGDGGQGAGGAPRSTSFPTSMGGAELPPTPAQRRRSWARWLPVLALGLVVVVASGRLSVGWPWSGDDAPAAAGGSDDAGTFTREFENDPAFADAPWAANVRLSLLDAWNNLEFNAALGGWSIRDISSDYVNVRDGERRTAVPDPALGRPIEVWLVGASAAFGAGQRDEHTIASELVRRAGADGIPLRVRNLAVPATVNLQTATQLASRLLWDDPPDLIVVYDGANDLALQESLAARGLGDSDRPASLVDAEFDEILRERARERNAEAGLPAPVETTAPAPELTPGELGERVVTRYGNGVALIRRAAVEADVPVVFFWQPDLRAKAPLSEVDRSTLADVGIDESTIPGWRALSDRVRTALPGLGVEDLTTVYDGREDALYWDTVHTNETGSLLVAEAMYLRLLPQLLAARSSAPAGGPEPGAP